MYMGDWANLPRDTLASILASTGDNPVKFAGVCKGWSWVLDDPQFRRSIRFIHAPTTHASLHRAMCSFTRFLCSRPPVTTELYVDPDLEGPESKPLAIVAVGAVLLHLAPVLRELTLQPPCLSAALTGSHATDAFARLDRLLTFVDHALDLGRLARLCVVDLGFRGAHADVELPRGLEEARFRVYPSAPRAVLDKVLGLLRGMDRLRVLSLHTDLECTLGLEVLPGTLVSLDLHATTLMDVTVGDAMILDLEVLSLHMCRVPATDLADFVQQCRRLKALSLVNNWYDDFAFPVLNLRHLPLQAVAVVTDPYQPRLRCEFPRGIRSLALGHDDMEHSLQQPMLTDTVETLTLLAQENTAPDVFQYLWPECVRLPCLTELRVERCESVQLAAMLGQRCPPPCALTFEDHCHHNIEDELDMLADLGAPACVPCSPAW